MPILEVFVQVSFAHEQFAAHFAFQSVRVEFGFVVLLVMVDVVQWRKWTAFGHWQIVLFVNGQQRLIEKCVLFYAIRRAWTFNIQIHTLAKYSRTNLLCGREHCNKLLMFSLASFLASC